MYKDNLLQFPIQKKKKITFMTCFVTEIGLFKKKLSIFFFIVVVHKQQKSVDMHTMSKLYSVPVSK